MTYGTIGEKLAAVEAAPDDLHDSLSMAGQRGDVTVTSNNNINVADRARVGGGSRPPESEYQYN